MSRLLRRGAALALLLLAGCAAMRPAPEMRTYRLAYPPPDPSAATPLPVTVRVMPFGIAAAYDSLAFIYRSGPYDVGTDPYNRWIANPATMIADLIARDMAASKTVRAVLQVASAVPYDYELSGQIETLEERDEGGSCSAMLRVRIALAHVPPRGPRAVVMQDIFSAEPPCTEASAHGYAEAMSRAVQQVSDEIRAAVLSQRLAE
jgi:ABC-type uncharacterized transport system auxiliary subunit